jgi:plastocyanin
MDQVTRHVQITVDAGEISYSAALLRAHPGDTIQWWSNQGPFAIQFAGISPMLFGGRRSHLPEEGRYHLQGIVRDALPGAYRYACALVVDNEVHLDAGCPEIIIDTDPQG